MIHAAIAYVSAMPALDAVPYIVASVPALTILMLALAMCAHGLTSALEYILMPDVTAYLQDAASDAVDACIDAWTWIVDGTSAQVPVLERTVLEGEIIDTRDRSVAPITMPIARSSVVIDVEIDRSIYAVMPASWGVWSDRVQAAVCGPVAPMTSCARSTVGSVALRVDRHVHTDYQLEAYARKIADRLDAARALARRSNVRRRDARGRFMPMQA